MGWAGSCDTGGSDHGSLCGLQQLGQLGQLLEYWRRSILHIWVPRVASGGLALAKKLPVSLGPIMKQRRGQSR